MHTVAAVGDREGVWTMNIREVYVGSWSDLLHITCHVHLYTTRCSVLLWRSVTKCHANEYCQLGYCFLVIVPTTTQLLRFFSKVKLFWVSVWHFTSAQSLTDSVQCTAPCSLVHRQTVIDLSQPVWYASSVDSIECRSAGRQATLLGGLDVSVSV